MHSDMVSYVKSCIAKMFLMLKSCNLNAIRINIVDIGLLTIKSCRVSSVNFVDIIVFAIGCIVLVVSICKRLCVVLLVTLL